MAVSSSAAADPSSQASSREVLSTSVPSSSVNIPLSQPTSNGEQHSSPNGIADQHVDVQDSISIEPENAANTLSETSGPSFQGQVPAASQPSSDAAPAQCLPPGSSQGTPRESQSGSQKDINNGTKSVASSSKPPKSSTVNGNGTHKIGSPGTSRSHKKSVLSKLLRILIPCAYPDSSTHAIELPHDLSASTEPKEKQTMASTEEAVPKEKPHLSVNTSTKEPTPPASIQGLPAEIDQPAPETPPPAPENIMIPPTPPPQILPLEETEGVTSGAVQAPGSTGDISPTAEQKRHSRDSTPPTRGDEESEGSSFTEDDDLHDLDDLEEEERLIMNGGAGIPIGPDGVPRPLLPPIAPQHVGRKCLVLDLDETLVHSSFKSLQQADYVVPVEIEYHWHNVYVIKRPGVDTFLKKMGELYEIVVFTASLSKYADPVLDKLDIHQVVTHRLFRESCYNHKGNYVKDLSQLGRPIADTIILDNSPASYIFHPNNAVPVSSWFNDPHDTELTDLIPFLADLANVEDVRAVLDGAR